MLEQCERSIYTAQELIEVQYVVVTHEDTPVYSNLKSVLLNGAETRRTINTTIKKVLTFTNDCLRRIIQTRWPDTISYIDSLERTNQLITDVGDEIRRRRDGLMDWSYASETSINYHQAEDFGKLL